MFWAVSFVPERNILRPRPQVTLPPLSRLRLLPLLSSHRGPYNLRPRSYRHERRLALGSATILAPCRRAQARVALTTSIPSASSSATPLTKRARLSLPQQRAAPLLGRCGVGSCRRKSHHARLTICNGAVAGQTHTILGGVGWRGQRPIISDMYSGPQPTSRQPD